MPDDKRRSVSASGRKVTFDASAKHDLEFYPELSHNLTPIAAQFAAYNQELVQRTKERDELQQLLKDLKNEVATARSMAQRIKLSHDKSSNVSVGYRSKLQVLRYETALIPNDIRQVQKEVEELTRQRDRLEADTSRIKEEIKMMKTACNGIKEVIDRAQREVAAQQKERELYKTQSTQAIRQATLLKERVDEWIYANNAFISTLTAKTAVSTERR